VNQFFLLKFIDEKIVQLQKVKHDIKSKLVSWCCYIWLVLLFGGD